MHRKRYLKPGNLQDVRRRLWAAILEVSDLIEDQDCPPDRVLRAGHCLAQLASAYKSVVETASIDERLAALERAAASERNSP